MGYLSRLHSGIDSEGLFISATEHFLDSANFESFLLYARNSRSFNRESVQR